MTKLIRLQRWSIFDSDAMPMLFSKQRCDVDVFGHFLPSQSVRLFLLNHWDRLFSDVFPISEPMFGDDFLWETQKQRHAQIRDKLCVYQCSGGKRRKIHNK